MRIRDWWSDVVSSDLRAAFRRNRFATLYRHFYHETGRMMRTLSPNQPIFRRRKAMGGGPFLKARFRMLGRRGLPFQLVGPVLADEAFRHVQPAVQGQDRKSTRLTSSH